MKIVTNINGVDYTFELNRAIYKQLLQDKEYSKIQNDLAKHIDSNGKVNQEDFGNDISNALLSDLIITEKLFFYSLLKNQPDMTFDKSSELLDCMIEEDGSMEYAKEIITTLMENFTQGTSNAKKKERKLIQM